MEVVITIFISAGTIFLFAISPVPALPAVITTYSLNGNLVGFISTFIGSLLSSIFLYYVAQKMSNKIIIKFFKSKIDKINKLTERIKRVSFFELFLIMMSGQIPRKILSPTCGIARIKFKKFIIARALSALPIHIVYIISTSKFKDINNNFLGFNSSQIESLILSISICCTISYLIILVLKIIPKFYNQLKLKNKI